MPSQKITASPAGLYLQPNNLSQVPDGALEQADNVVISRDGIVEPRRGQSTFYTSAFGDAVSSAWPGAYGSTPGIIGLEWNTGRLLFWLDGFRSGAPTVLTGSTDLPRVGRSSVGPSMPAHVSNNQFQAGSVFGGFLYGSSGSPVYRCTSSTVSAAGVPPALDLSSALSAAGTPTALANNTQVAYRWLWLRKVGDAVLRGSPSQRLVVSNTSGGTRDVTLTASVPSGTAVSGWGVQSGDIFQLYRSLSSPTGTEPSDELGLVYEGTYSSGLTVSVTDVVTDTLIGAALYTNATQEGILKSNDLPPPCYDLAPYRQSMFYANTLEFYASLQVLATGVGAVDVGSTITIDGVTITGAAGENIGAKQFLVDTASASIPDRWRNTAASIVRVYNRSSAVQPAANFYALDVDTTIGMPGNIRIIAKGTAYGSLFITSTAPSSALKITGGGGDVPVQHRGRIHWSKMSQPESVPALNYADVGNAKAAILRIVATRDSLFIFKEDGLWRLTGDAEPWDIRPFDPTCILYGVRTPAVLDNSVYARTNQGVVRVTDTGVTVVSRPIEPLLGVSLYAIAEDQSFGVAYESARMYLLWTGDTQSVTGVALKRPTVGLAYNIFTEAWTARTDPQLFGAVTRADDRLILGTGTTMTEERKAGDDTDYADPSGAISCAVKWAPKFATPGLKQHFQEVGFLFRKLGGTAVTLAFTTDLVPSPPGSVNVTLSDYGTPPFSPFSLRTLVPLEQARGSQLGVSFSQNVNGSTFQIQGLSLTHRVTDEEAGS